MKHAFIMLRNIIMNKIDSTGTVYTGSFININNKCMLHGYGEIITEKGMVYNGYFIYGKKHGLFKVLNINTKEESIVTYDFDKLMT